MNLQKRTAMLLAECIYFSGFSASAADAPIILRGQVGCGNWMAGRATDYAGPLEQLVIGYLNGLSRALNVAFWRVDATDEQKPVYGWMDNYCGQHAMGTVLEGADLLFKERTGKSP